MTIKSRRFARKVPKKTYRKLFVISAEGRETEKIYFSSVRKFKKVHFKWLTKKNDNDPKHILKRAEDYLVENRLGKNDSLWLVVDEEHGAVALKLLYDWCKEDNKRHLIVSNPKFEIWILFHFEDAKSIKTSKDCNNKINNYIPSDPKKKLPKETRDNISKAIERAKSRGTSSYRGGWHRTTGTTVYKLVEALIKAEEE